MLPAIHIIIGACGGKMADYWIKQSRSEGQLLIPLMGVEEYSRVYATVRLRTNEPASFRATCWCFRSTPKLNLSPGQIAHTVYQCTQAVPDGQYLLVKAQSIPKYVKEMQLSGGYEFLHPIGHTVKLTVNTFKAMFSYADDQWHVTGIENAGERLD